VPFWSLYTDEDTPPDELAGSYRGFGWYLFMKPPW